MKSFLNQIWEKKLLHLLVDPNLKQIFEIGCGNGRWEREDSRITGIECNVELLDKEDSFKSQRVILGDAFTLKEKNKYDCVFSTGVIEHYPLVIMQELINIHYQLLKKDGKAIIIVPNKGFEGTLEKWEYGKDYESLKYDLGKRISQEQLKEGMEKAGFKNIQIFSSGEFARGNPKGIYNKLKENNELRYYYLLMIHLGLYVFNKVFPYSYKKRGCTLFGVGIK